LRICCIDPDLSFTRRLAGKDFIPAGKYVVQPAAGWVKSFP
jgi:hypothetical protein